MTGGNDLSLEEVQQAVSTVSGVASPDADVFFGATVEPDMTDGLQVMLVAVGMNGQAAFAISEPGAYDMSSGRWPRGGKRASPAAVHNAQESQQPMDLYDLDVPTFLRRRKLARIGEETA